MSMKKLRKSIYVDRGVQGGIVLRLVLLWFASTGVAVGVWFVLQYFANPTEGLEYYLEDAGRNVFPLLLAFGVTMPIAVLQLLRFTHRFAGPVIRLRRFMNTLANGQPVSKLKFRDHDYWPELADEFNSIASQLNDARRRVAELENDLRTQRDTGQVTGVVQLDEAAATV